jgi:hypothetical protein
MKIFIPLFKPIVITIMLKYLLIVCIEFLKNYLYYHEINKLNDHQLKENLSFKMSNGLGLDMGPLIGF